MGIGIQLNPEADPITVSKRLNLVGKIWSDPTTNTIR
jgi:hypothetical protein